MGSLIGHVLPGLAFFLVGLWHLFNHTKLHLKNPNSYTSLPWFPTAASRHLELYLVMLSTVVFVAIELFIMPHHHHPLDTDGTIPSNHLHNMEHANIALSIFSYAFFAVVLDRVKPPERSGLTHMLGVVTLAHELLVFNLHSTDHTGVEGQYHWLLQVVLLTCLATMVVTTKYSTSFLLSFVRSLTLAAQGVWLVVMGYMLYTPGLIPMGCVLVREDKHQLVKCEVSGALRRAKSLVNILFSYYMIGMSVFGMVTYLVMYRMYSCKDEAGKHGESTESEDEEMKGFLKNGKGFAVMNLER